MDKKISKCPECKSEEILITSNPKGEVFSILCQDCGWSFESPKFMSLAKNVDDVINDFSHEDFVKTKKKLI